MLLKIKRDEKNYSTASEPKLAIQIDGSDLRDLFIRMQSSDYQTKQLAKKKLLNFIYEETKKY